MARLVGDTFYGSSGNDYMSGDSLDNLMYGFGGNDSLNGGDGNDTIDGGDGHDQLYGNAGSDFLIGGSGYDYLVGGDGNDSINGGNDNDSLTGDSGDDTLDGGNGSDWANYYSTNGSVQVNLSTGYVTGAQGTDQLFNIENIYGSNYNDLLIGNSENNTIWGFSGNDSLDGSDGDDKLDGDGGNDNIFGGDGNDSLNGGDGYDYISGGDGNDSINGGNDDDTLTGYSGDDTLDGGNGSDWASYYSTNGSVQVNLSTGYVTGAQGTDQLFNIENIYGSNYNDLLIGNSENNTIWGFSGNDSLDGSDGDDKLDGDGGNDNIFGGDGNDSLSGGDGNDYLNGGDGNDSISGGDGDDTIDGGSNSDWGGDFVNYHLANGGVEVNLSTGYATDAQGTDQLFNIENIAGSRYSDMLIGNSANNYIFGGWGGNDTLNGGDGNDTLNGGNGNNNIDGGSGTDIAQYNDLRSNYTIEEGVNSLTISSKNGIDTITNVESIQFTDQVVTVGGGGGTGQVITGTSQADTLSGTKGNDTFNADAGIDTVSFTGQYANYTLIKTSSSDYSTWTIASAADGTDTLNHVERLRFTDKNIALDIDGNGGMAYRIYQAAFDRAPDKNGLGAWIYRMDKGMTLLEVAQGFVQSEEFNNLYGASPSNATLVNKFYQNVLHRVPEQAGYDWWLSNLNTGAMTPAKVLAEFSESAENKNNLVKIIGNGFEYDLWTNG